jgi:hypothetical protein
VATFTPPVAYDNPPILPNAGGLANRLFRYFPNRKRYIAVFALSDGTFVQDTPNGFDLSGNLVGVTNTNIPYPYNPYDPSAPYSTSYYVDYSLRHPKQIKTTVSQNPYVIKVYLGPTAISPTLPIINNAANPPQAINAMSEQAALTKAGYGGCIQ